LIKGACWVGGSARDGGVLQMALVVTRLPAGGQEGGQSYYPCCYVARCREGRRKIGMGFCFSLC